MYLRSKIGNAICVFQHLVTVSILKLPQLSVHGLFPQKCQPRGQKLKIIISEHVPLIYKSLLLLLLLLFVHAPIFTVCIWCDYFRNIVLALTEWSTLIRENYSPHWHQKEVSTTHLDDLQRESK